MQAALLRLWLLAEIGLAVLHGWQCWALWRLPDTGQAPYVPRAVPVVAGLCLFIILPALAVAAGLGWQRRDKGLAGLVLAYGLAMLARFGLGADASSLGQARWLHALAALTALAGVLAAIRAHRLLARG